MKKNDKGGKINEEEIPPPVSTKVSKPINPQTQTLPGPPANTVAKPETPVGKFTAPTPSLSSPASPTSLPRSEVTPAPPATAPAKPPAGTAELLAKVNLLMERQKQFKVLALQLKQQGDMDGARKNLAISKVFRRSRRRSPLNSICMRTSYSFLCVISFIMFFPIFF